MNENNDFIGIYDNSVPQDLCNELVEWFDLCSDGNFTEHNMAFSDGRIDPISRADESISIPNSSSPVSSFSLSGAICDAYWNVLNKCCNEYITKYNLNNSRLSCYGFKLHKVKLYQKYLKF